MRCADDYPVPLDARLVKRALRKQLRLANCDMSAAERTEQSAQICRNVLKSSLWQSSSSILFYFPLDSEVDINPLIENGLITDKTISLPRFDSDIDKHIPCVIRDFGELVEGIFGVNEPSDECPIIEPNQLDLAIVPGVGFDALGARLGRGGGHYDRLLRNLTAVICGVCFRQQVLPQVPEEDHDIKMDYIVTPEGWLTDDPR